MPIADTQPRKKEELESAFLLFNQASEQLVESYQQLQERVQHLSTELAAARHERLCQLAEKEQLANRLSRLLDALPAAVVVLDGNECVEQHNPAAEQLFETIKVGQRWDDLYQTAFLVGQSGEERYLRSGRLVSVTERTLCPAAGRILLLLDITETRELQARLDRQKRLSAMGEMAAQLAHQIRTPLASALLYTSHMVKGNLSLERRRYFAERLRDRIQLIGRQVNDMLAFAKGGQYAPEPVVMDDLIKGVVQMLKQTTDLRAVQIEIDDTTQGACMVRGNRDALQGAFTNLLNNAIQHGGDGVHIRIELAKHNSEWLQLLLSDNGPGIPESHQEKVFDPFFTTRSDGTGLGLAVVQSVILGHNGSIKLLSKKGDGACFQLRLPLASDELIASSKGVVRPFPKHKLAGVNRL